MAMLKLLPLSILLPTLLGWTEPPQARGPVMEGKGHAEARRKAEQDAFGNPTLEYLDFKSRTAARELKAWNRLIGPKAFLAAAVGEPTWVNLGPQAESVFRSQPDLDGGRITAILPHPTDPKILYVATSAGIFKCTNADLAEGAHWTWLSIGDTLPSSSAAGNLSIGALALNPDDPKVLYAGMGDPFAAPSRGFYISSDGGGTWVKGGDVGTATRTLCIQAQSGGFLLVGTDQGLFRSTNGGTSFSLLPLGGFSGSVWSIQAFSATDLICSQDGALFYSVDGGATWQRASLSPSASALQSSRITVVTSPASGSQAWGCLDDQNSGNVTRGLLKTTDKGHSWTFEPAPTAVGGLFQGKGWNGDPTNPGSADMPYEGGQGTYNQGLAVDPTDPSKVFLGANLCLYRTLNGGTSWEQMTHWAGYTHVYCHADFHIAAWSRTGPKTLFLGTDGGLAVLKQPDLSPLPNADWDVKVNSVPAFLDHSQNQGLATQLIYNLGSTLATVPADSRARITGGLQDNGIIVRQDQGSGLANSTSFPEANQANGDTLAGDGFGTVIHPVNGDLMLGAEQFDFIFKSRDGGATWSLSDSGIAEVNGDAPFYARLVLGLGDPTGNLVYTTTNHRIYRSTDFGDHWAAMDMTGYGGQTIRNVAASTIEPSTVALVSSGTGYLNRGGTWSAFGTFPTTGSASALRLWNLSFDPADATTLYACSTGYTAVGNHVWKSINRGASWTALDTSSNGFPFGIPVFAIQAAPWSAQELYAGTDLGLYRSTDKGATWARYGTGMPLVSVRDIYLAADGSFIRVATWGRGIWELKPNSTSVQVSLSPATAQLPTHGKQAFSATITGSTDLGVIWTLQEPLGGQITPEGLYTAPATPGTYHVVATSHAAPSAAAIATVTVRAGEDVNLDGTIDILDLAFLAQAYGTAGPAGDLDGSGWVDDADLAAWLAKF